MPSLYPSFIRFALYFFATTCGFGLLGMLITQTSSALLNQILSFSVLLPYLISFYLMTQHYIKTHHAVPQNAQRWKLSFGCVGIFWLYSLLAMGAGLLMSGENLDQSALSSLMFIGLLLGIMLIGLSLLLILLGYFFLGKPAQIMLTHAQKR